MVEAARQYVNQHGMDIREKNTITLMQGDLDIFRRSEYCVQAPPALSPPGTAHDGRTITQGFRQRPGTSHPSSHRAPSKPRLTDLHDHHQLAGNKSQRLWIAGPLDNHLRTNQSSGRGASSQDRGSVLAANSTRPVDCQPFTVPINGPRLLHNTDNKDLRGVTSSNAIPVEALNKNGRLNEPSWIHNCQTQQYA